MTSTFLSGTKTLLNVNQHSSTPPFLLPSFKIHWDNACSYNLSNTAQLFHKLFPLPNPIPIGGVGGHCTATHAGYLKCLPSTHFMNFGLYSSTAPQTLLSLGFLHQCGGHFHTSTNPNSLIIYANSTTQLDSTPLLPNTHLYRANLTHLMHAIRTQPTLRNITPHSSTLAQFPPLIQQFLTKHPPELPSPPSALLLRAFNGEVTSSTTLHPILPHLSTPQPIASCEDPPPLTSCINADSSSPEAPPLPPITYRLPKMAFTRRITNSEYSRLLASRDLHYTQSHPPDAKLCTELANGKHSYSNLTGADIILMRKVFGPCPHCPAGRAYKPAAIRQPSTTPPATRPGETISFDPQKLPSPVLGGFTHKVLMVDEHTGHISQPGISSKSNAALATGIQNIIHTKYNANGHRVDSLHGDAERVNISLAPFLGSIGTRLKISLPGHHAHRAERSTQTISSRDRSVLSHLPYEIPPELTLLLSQSVGETLNNSVCKASFPLTPNEALSGFKPQRAPIAFGRCAMVMQPDDKRRTISVRSGSPLKLVPITELGVCMGLIPGTDQSRWLLANGMVVPRIPIGPLLPDHFVPFNWKRKAVIPLPPPSTQHITIVDSPQDVNTKPNSLNLTNNSVQTPSLSPIETLNIPTLTDDIISINNNAFLPAHLPASATPKTAATTTDESRLPLPSQPLPTVQFPPPQLDLAPPILAPPILPIVISSAPSLPLPAPLIPQLPLGAPLVQPPSLPIDRRVTRSQTRSSSSNQTPASYGGWGAHFSESTPRPLLTGHKFRKMQNSRTASTRDRLHLQLFPIPDNLNNRSTDERPRPPIRQQNEWPLHKALTVLDPTRVTAAVQKELTKIFTTYKSLKVIPQSSVEPTAVFLPNKLIIREKLNKDITARLALGGDRQPPHTYGDTHAGTSDSTHRAFTLAAGQAHASQTHQKLITFAFDVPAAFLNKNALPREKTGNVQLITKSPSIFPPPYSNSLCEIIGAHYGLKQSNHIYDQDFIKLMTSDGFIQCPSHPYSFQKWSIPHLHTLPSHHIFVSMHVDDGDGNTTSPTMLQDFKTLLTNRYGPLEFHNPSKGTCGQTQRLNPDNSITLHYGPYIQKLLTRIGMDNVPPALSPDIKGLFDPSEDTTPLSDTAISEFRTVNGELIHTLPQRHDIRKVVTHLLTMNEKPDQGCYLKQLHLLRYLKSCPDIGPTFSADPSNYPNGVELHSASDCAHNVHINGQSHGAFQITLGRPGATTAPFTSYSAAEKGVSLHPHEGEYVILSKTAKALIHWRQFAEDLGFPQLQPSIMLTDNATSINLTKSPLIPAKSRHIALNTTTLDGPSKPSKFYHNTKAPTTLCPMQPLNT